MARLNRNSRVVAHDSRRRLVTGLRKIGRLGLLRRLGCIAGAIGVLGVSVACNTRLDVLDVEPRSDAAVPSRKPDASLDAAVDAAAEPRDAGSADHPDARADGGTALPPFVVASYDETCAAISGAVYCWGAAPDGHTRSLPEPLAGAGAADFVRITSGASSHCAERVDGSIWCWGTNDHGELGQGDRTARVAPVRVRLSGSATGVRGHFDSFCATLDGGALECWGDDEEGELGQGGTYPGEDALAPVSVRGNHDFSVADVGQGHACGATATGALWCWGRDSDGELGLPADASEELRSPALVDGTDGWSAVATGQNHTCALTRGALYCFGANFAGQLGQGDQQNRSVPTRVGTDADWVSIDVDTFHSCGIRAPGTLWCWGRNVEGQLGTGDTSDRPSPVQVGHDADWVQVSTGRFHTCALRADDSIWCTGANDDGRLGTGDLERRDVLTRVVMPNTNSD